MAFPVSECQICRLWGTATTVASEDLLPSAEPTTFQPQGYRITPSAMHTTLSVC